MMQTNYEALCFLQNCKCLLETEVLKNKLTLINSTKFMHIYKYDHHNWQQFSGPCYSYMYPLKTNPSKDILSTHGTQF